MLSDGIWMRQEFGVPYERHEVVVAVVVGDKSRDAIVAFREAMPEQVKSLLIGPVYRNERILLFRLDAGWSRGVQP